MRLWELFGDLNELDVTPATIKGIEHELDATVYQSPDRIQKNRNAIDLELPTQGHFMDRIVQRSDKQGAAAGISPEEVQSLLARARTDPKLGAAADIDAAARDDRPTPNDDITVQDNKTKLRIPMAVVPNPEARGGRVSPNSSVAMMPNGKKVPKNELVAKTVYRNIK